MKIFCDCEDAVSLLRNSNNLFVHRPPYGWVVQWIELTDEKGYTQVHKYGLSIKFCPLCGKKLMDGDMDGQA